MSNRGDDEDHYSDDRFAFNVRCEACGCEYDNRDSSCPNCRSCDVSYTNEDARRWNNHLRRTGRG